MANVLGELFGDIASAIREKTGDTATMKPAEFPAKISGIEVGGGSGGGGTPVVTMFTFTPTDEISHSVEHGLGVVPDIVYLRCATDSFAAYKLIYAVGLSKAAYDAGLTLPKNYVMGISNTAASLWDNSSNASICCIDEPKPDGNLSYCKPISADETTITFKANSRWEPMFNTAKPYRVYVVTGLT